jgi:hypothetical protein
MTLAEEEGLTLKREGDCVDSKKKHCFLFLDPRVVASLRPRMTGERGRACVMRGERLFLLASLRGVAFMPDAAIHFTGLSLKDGLSPFTVILEGTPHRKCHIEDPSTALLQTKT